MLNEKISRLLNEQINHELYSAYLYECFSQSLYIKNLMGFGAWYQSKADEEISHARRIAGYLIDQGRRPANLEIKKPILEADSLVSIGEESLNHERFITEKINCIYKEAELENDYRTKQFLSWFIEEQTSEEAEAKEMLSLIKMIDKNNAAIYFADANLIKN